jgi:GT2 family glycosyltransferase
MSHQLDLSILIVNWNGDSLLDRCFRSIEQCKGDLAIEVVLFDNGSTDNSLEIVDSWAARLNIITLHAAQNIGFAIANNRAWDASHAEVCLLLNNDAIIGGPLRRAVDYMRSNPLIAVCQGPILSADGQRIDSVGSLITRWGFLVHPVIGEPASTAVPSRPVFSAKGAAMFVRSEAIRRIGLFDESAFAYFEESDFCWRARIAGWETMFSNELAPVFHVGGATSKRLAGSVPEYHSFKNRLRAILKNASGGTLLAMLPGHLTLCCLGMLAALAARRPSGAVTIARALFWNLKVSRKTWLERRRVQQLRMRSDREALGIVSEPLGLGRMLSLALSYERYQRVVAARIPPATRQDQVKVSLPTSSGTLND